MGLSTNEGCAANGNACEENYFGPTQDVRLARPTEISWLNGLPYALGPRYKPTRGTSYVGGSVKQGRLLSKACSIELHRTLIGPWPVVVRTTSFSR